ncbi:MAG TPA: RNA polymerase sigma factor [Kiritimatiellia bacterium]|nr:RNA polymerase sigma factor [Kiritimatiellia bacterium]HRU70798.1 RNA polymerase sigma factor [Kiritimatiellia bacterium]
MEGAPIEQMDDADLMLRVCDQDDEAAFALLVSRHQRSLLNFFARSGVQYDSEDLVQQTFLRLYRYRQRYQATAKFTTFLFLLARQVWIDELRRRQRRQRLAESLAAEPYEEFAAPADSSAGVAGDLDLARALAALPEGLRQVVELAVYQGLPYAEVAAILGIPVGTVKSRMFNALAKLRALLGEERGDKP